MLQDFGNLFIFIIGGVGFVTAGLITAKLIRANRPNEEKLTVYECGEDPIGSSWGQFNIRFYVVALMFVLFEAEIVFLIPWSVVFADEALMEASGGSWGWFTFTEMFIFLGILFLGLVYAWRKGFLEWEKPQIGTVDYSSPVPEDLYTQINQRYHSSTSMTAPEKAETRS